MVDSHQAHATDFRRWNRDEMDMMMVKIRWQAWGLETGWRGGSRAG
jgi:hypothetical protein